MAQRGVAVEMIGGEVEVHGDARPERLDRLKLEGADLGDRIIEPTAHRRHLAEGLAKVAAGHGFFPGQRPLALSLPRLTA